MKTVESVSWSATRGRGGQLNVVSVTPLRSKEKFMWFARRVSAVVPGASGLATSYSDMAADPRLCQLKYDKEPVHSLAGVNQALEALPYNPVQQIEKDPRRVNVVLVFLSHPASWADLAALAELKEIDHLSIDDDRAYGGKVITLLVPDYSSVMGNLRSSINMALRFGI